MSHDLVHLFHQSEFYFINGLCIAHKRLPACGDAFYTGVPSALFNPIIVRHEVDNKSLIEIETFFAHHKTPWCMIVPEYLLTPTLRERLAENTLLPKEKTLAMVLSLGSLPPAENNVVHLIKPMSDQLEQWMLPLVLAFKSTLEI